MARIIVVDDDHFVGTAIKALLQRQGFDVVLARGGLAGLSALGEASFDVALVDIFMAGMDGLETITAMKALAPRMPVVAMSGFMDRDTDVRSWYFLNMAAELGATCSLSKPFRPQELMAAIETCLGRPLPEPKELPKKAAS